ncbi:PqqD family protein [bacterium]|nr:PqqD family protein [bacterium]
MVQLDSTYAKDPLIVSRLIDDEVILIPIRQNVGDLESIYTLNETAARFWELLDGQRTLADICDLVVTEYEVDQEEAQSELVEFIKQLEEFDAVKRA